MDPRLNARFLFNSEPGQLFLRDAGKGDNKCPNFTSGKWYRFADRTLGPLVLVENEKGEEVWVMRYRFG